MRAYYTLTIIFILAASASANPFFTWGEAPLSEDGDACTIAVIFGYATPDGRPVLWKNRDVSNWRQEFRYYDLEPYSFIAVNYPMIEYDDEAYGGVNEVGFAIMDGNALNFPDSSGYDDDGIIMYHALQTCETVNDFLAYMDTTATFGRSRPAIYGVFDAYGNAGMLEVSMYENFWYGADSTTDGIMVRANFAYSGGEYYPSLQHRHDRALELIQNAVAGDSLSPYYILDIVARDLTTELLDPYPLPYDGYYVYQHDTLWNAIRDHYAINREISQSGFAAHGVMEEENPLLSTIWAVCGEPTMTPALPLWVAAESVPDVLDGDANGSDICIRAREIFSYLYYNFSDPYDDVINTRKLQNEAGRGVLPAVRGLESTYYDYIVEQVEDWRINFPDPVYIQNLQDSIAIMVYHYMMRPSPIEDLTISHDFTSGSVTLSWSPVVTTLMTDTVEVNYYNVYWDTVSSEFDNFTVTATEDTFFTVDAGDFKGYFQVTAERNFE